MPVKIDLHSRSWLALRENPLGTKGNGRFALMMLAGSVLAGSVLAGSVLAGLMLAGLMLEGMAMVRALLPRSLMGAAGALVFLGVTAVQAHTPLFACYDNGDGTVFCEGGFSDGSSATGVPVRVRDASGKVVVDGKMNADSEFEFTKPDGSYSVLFDGGEGHQIEVPGEDIVE